MWFRRGLGAAAGGQDDSNDRDTGTAWLLMVGSLSLITLGPNDQVRKESEFVVQWGKCTSISVYVFHFFEYRSFEIVRIFYSSKIPHSPPE